MPLGLPTTKASTNPSHPTCYIRPLSLSLSPIRPLPIHPSHPSALSPSFLSTHPIAAMASSSRARRDQRESEDMARTLRVAGDMSGLTFLDETSLRKYGPEQILSRMLSTKYYISTDLSHARNGLPHLKAAQELGAGMCGVVYALTGTEWAIKLSKPEKADELYRDYCNHIEVEEAFHRLPLAARPAIPIPRTGDWIHPSNEQFWQSYQPRFPTNTPRNYGLISARIFPLPEPVREAVWDHFVPRSASRQALAEKQNKDCLVRVYLGRRQDRTATPNFKLRNFELSINEMEFLRPDTMMYAEVMAATLAFLHWKVALDANDVEFVLGSSPLVKPRATAAEHRQVDKDGARFLGQEFDFTRRAIGLWLLDFNQCKKFTQSQEGLKQMVNGFRWNDPYYPRPGSENTQDQSLWAHFEKVYLEASASLQGPQWMAEAFIKEVKSPVAKKVDSLF